MKFFLIGMLGPVDLMEMMLIGNGVGKLKDHATNRFPQGSAPVGRRSCRNSRRTMSYMVVNITIAQSTPVQVSAFIYIVFDISMNCDILKTLSRIFFF